MFSFEQVVEEIINNVTNTEPWVAGANGIPSSIFCCLYRLMQMRLTEKQVYQLVRPDMLYVDNVQVQAQNNPYVRAVGFLFIRFLAPPE